MIRKLSPEEVTKCQEILAEDTSDVKKLFEVSEFYLPYLKDTQLYYALLGFRDYCKSHPEMLK